MRQNRHGEAPIFVWPDSTPNVLIFLFSGLLVAHLLLTIRAAQHILKEGIEPKNERVHPTVSVIVAAHNELKNLQELVPLLLKQDYSDFEILLALDRSTDGSLEWLQTQPHPRLKVIDCPVLPAGIHGKKYAITQAIEIAKGDWALLTDADCRPASPHWIGSFARKMNDDTELLLGVSAYTPSSGLPGSLIQYETFMTAFQYTAACRAGSAYMGVGRNLAYSTRLFRQAGGFGAYAHIVGGDDDLFVQTHATSTNTKMVLGVDSLTYSTPKRTWGSYLHQKIRHLSVGKYYQPKVKKAQMFRVAIHFLLWLSFLYLAVSSPHRLALIGAFGLMLVIKGLIFTAIAKKIHTPFSIFWFPLSDFLYSVFIPLIGASAFFVTQTRWK